MKKSKTNIFDQINLKSGQLDYFECYIDPNLNFEQQKWDFKQGLIQISFGKYYIVDVGWYPEYKHYGEFTIEVIMSYDWDNPIFKKVCKNVETLKKHLQKAIDFTDQLYCAKRN